MILSDFDLRGYLEHGRLVIQPLDYEQVRENGIDLRVGDSYCRILDDFDVLDLTGEVSEKEIRKKYECFKGQKVFELDPNARYLLTTIEYVKMPNELMAFVELRSTFARLGFVIPPTIIDGGFEGQITIEVLTPPYPVRLSAGTRMLHIVFGKLSSTVMRAYRGKYHGQVGATPPKL